LGVYVTVEPTVRAGYPPFRLPTPIVRPSIIHQILSAPVNKDAAINGKYLW